MHKIAVGFCSALLLTGIIAIPNMAAGIKEPASVEYTVNNEISLPKVSSANTTIPVFVEHSAPEPVSEDVSDVPIKEPAKLLFIGNSLVVGLKNDDWPFLCKVGISLPALISDYLPKTKDIEYNTVVVEMGTNELGHYEKDAFISDYSKLLDGLHGDVYILSIPPVNEAKSSLKYRASVNNSNVQLYNSWIKELCEDQGCTYVDCTEFFGESLKSDWTGDGIHLNGSVYSAWYDWILERVG